MRRVILTVAVLGLTACPPEAEKCVILVKSVYPADGATDGYYKAAIDFELSNPDPTAVITTDIPGTQSTNADGKHILWTPDAPLTPGQSYSASLAYCAGEASTSFTVSDAGNPITDPAGLVGQTYLFDLHSGRVPVPAGLGDVLIDNLAALILLGVESVSDTTMGVIGAVSILGETGQDYCSPTIPFADADFSGAPDIAFAVDQTTLVAAGTEVDVFEVALTGTFRPDGSAIEGMTFSGMIDTRPLAPLVDSGDGTENAICELAENFNAACVACPSDGQVFCLEIQADHITAALDPGTTVVEICEANAPDCNPGPPADTCAG